MHPVSVTREDDPAAAARCGSALALRAMMCEARSDTLATFGALALALPGLQVPYDETLNPPLWELGHVGWFQTRWLERHPDWRLGVRADPTRPLRPARDAHADACFDSTRVAHATRWHLALPPLAALREELDAGLEATLALLHEVAGSQAGSAATASGVRGCDDPLYFFRLVLLHEDMHHEAALSMGRALGVPLIDARWQSRRLDEPLPALILPAATWHTGHPVQAQGFVFDNECGPHEVALPASEIDPQVLRWAEFLPFVEAGGYTQPRHWTPEGWAWLHGPAPGWRRLAAAGAPAAEPPAPGDEDGPVPRYLRRRGRHWERWRDGLWQRLDLQEAACHLSHHEALAWCAWAGRRLPTEHEWERAACTQPEAFAWGEVWEWTASPFRPYPGFTPHPYREYSAPWFDGRPVLRGASCQTQPRLRDARYRNYFTAGRHDVPAGFRTCACG
jgi:iron(II)-dependent oxidoreductase